jgi:hypothetical protein
MWTWVVRGVLAAFAIFLVVASVPRSSLTPAATAAPAPIAAASGAPVATKAAETCRGLDNSGGSPIPFPARTAADVIAGTGRDPSIRQLLNDLVGVRPGPTRDPRAPACRPDLLELGPPVFVRQYPATIGRWLVPVRYQDQTLVTVFVHSGVDGMGTIGGNRGGGIAIPSESEARVAGGTPADPVTSAELVLGNASCGRDLVMWRLVRRSGATVYLIPEFPGAAPPGALLRDGDVWFSTSGRPHANAKLSAAC